MPPRTYPVAVLGLLAATACVRSGSGAAAAASDPDTGRPRIANARAEQALAAITIPSADDVRGSVTLPSSGTALPGATLRWTSSHPQVVSDRADGAVAAAKTVSLRVVVRARAETGR